MASQERSNITYHMILLYCIQQIEQQNNLIKQNENKVEECNKSIILL